MLPKSRYFDFHLYAVNAEDELQSAFIEKGTFDYVVSKWIVDNVSRGWTIYDIGANIFEYTELFARKSGETGIVHAFEPQNELVKGYKIARRYNDYTGVAPIKIYQVALSNEDSYLELKKSDTHSGLASLNFDQVERNIDAFNSVEVVRSLRADSSELALPQAVPDLLKLDIEGAEKLFWEGAPDFLKNSKRILAEVTYKVTSNYLIEEYLKNRVAYSIHTKKTLSTVDEIVKEIKNQPHQQSNIVFTQLDIESKRSSN